MRGHLDHLPRLDQAVWSIPADAGAPAARSASAGVVPVYPRGCGGTGLAPIGMARSLGLSPRMRGHRESSAVVLKLRRSIPADAGAPSQASISSSAAEVYPRGCGGTPAPVCQEPGATGPSLRVSRRTRDSLSQGQSAFLNVWVRSGKCNSAADSVRFAFVSEKITVNRPGVDVVIHPPLSLPTSGPVPHG